MYALGRDINSELSSKFAMVSTSVTAGGAGDATEITGATIDLRAVTGKPGSVSFNIPCRAVLAATKTLVVAGKVEDSADGTNFADLVASATLLTLTGAGGGSTETGMARIGVDLTKARRYVRMKATPDLSAANTDTAVIGAGVAVFGGFQEVPQA